MAKAKTKPKKRPNGVIHNRRAAYDYTLGETIIAGIVLTGPEVRAAREGLVQLKGSFVTLRGGEAWLNNASFSLKLNQKGSSGQKTVDTSSRKLLLKRKQIQNLQIEKDKGFTIVPLKLITGQRFIKLMIAPGRGKRQYDKRHAIKAKDIAREQKRSGGIYK